MATVFSCRLLAATDPGWDGNETLNHDKVAADLLEQALIDFKRSLN